MFNPAAELLDGQVRTNQLASYVMWLYRRRTTGAKLDWGSDKLVGRGGVSADDLRKSYFFTVPDPGLNITARTDGFRVGVHFGWMLASTCLPSPPGYDTAGQAGATKPTP